MRRIVDDGITPVSYIVLRKTNVALASPTPSTSYSTILAQKLDVTGWGAGALQVRVFDKTITGTPSSVRIAVFNVEIDRDDPSVTFESADLIAYVDILDGISSSPQLFIVRLPTVADLSVALGRQVTVKLIVNAGPNSISGNLTLAVDLIGYRGMIGPKGSAGINAYATSTLSFTAPVLNGTSTFFGADCTWAAAGQRVFLSNQASNTAGYFRVASNGTATSVDLTNEEGSQAGSVFATGS